jgi:hypothetical protein
MTRKKNEQIRKAKLQSRMVDIAIGPYVGELIQLTNQESQLALFRYATFFSI